MSLPWCTGMKRDVFASSINAQPSDFFCSKSVKSNDARLRDQFLLHSMKISY